MTLPLEVLLNLHRKNPLVLLVQANQPNISADSALLVAMETYSLHAAGISTLGRLASEALQELGESPSLRHTIDVATDFLHAITDSGTESRANLFLAGFPALRERVMAVTDPEGFDTNEVRKLLQDLVAIKHGGEAAE